MPAPFATATELSEFIGITEPADLARPQALLDAASEAIRRHCGGQILSVVTNDQITIQPQFSATTGQTIPLPAAYGELIFLPERPVTAVSITISAVSFTAFGFTPEGIVYRTDGLAWTKAAVVTYTHGYAETSHEFAQIRGVCLEIAANAYTMNQGGATTFQGNTTAETAGFAPAIFLTPAQKDRLNFGGKVYVG